jgi:hypothetical protein
MRKRLYTCVVLILVLCAARAEAQFNAPQPPAPGEDYHVELGYMFWSPDPELVLRTDAPQAIGSEIDFVQEFGIEDERFREFRAVLKMGRKHKLRLSYLPIRYEAEAVIARTITFSGRTFTVGAPATANVEWNLWRVGYEWDVVSTGRAFFGVIGELKYNKVSAEIAAVGIAVEAAEAQAPIPAIGAIARGYVSKNVSVTAEFTGFKLPDSISEENDAEFWDLDVYATVNLGRNLGVQGGYRSLDVEYIFDQDLGRLKMKGLYFGGVVRF